MSQPPGPPAPGALPLRVAAAYALGHVLTTLSLDDVWNTELGDTPQRVAPPPSFEGLRDLVAALDMALEQLPAYADATDAGLRAASANAVNEAVQAMARITPRAAEGMDAMTQHEEFLGWREYLRTACADVRDAVPSERELLASKRRVLDHGELPGPDLSPEFRSGLQVVGLAAGTVGTILSGGSVAAVAPTIGGAGATFMSDWAESACPKAIHTLRDRVTRGRK